MMMMMMMIIVDWFDRCWEAAAGSAMWGYAGPVIIIALVRNHINTQDKKQLYQAGIHSSKLTTSYSGIGVAK